MQVYKQQNIVPMKPLTPEQLQRHSEADKCHICGEKLIENPVRDHCAHQDCNLHYKDSRVIPVVFHNLSGYDAHLIIRDISNEDPGNVYLLPLNKEKYISFTKHFEHHEISFRFIDSFRFMASSLDKLASYLPEHEIMRTAFPNMDKEKLELLTTKGIFSYEYIDSREKLNETALPTQEQFYSSLYDTSVSDEEYEFTKRVWSTFNVSNLMEYAELYMKVDVLLLAEVFEKFREQSMDAYGLDPAHYYTSPGLAWDAMLKYTNAELELLTDIEKVLFIESGIGGGISQCSNRFATANNKYMADYNPEEESKYLLYLDANNLYGWAMTQYLPYKEFTWVSPDKEVLDVPDDSNFGYILEVDLEYPQDLHDKHNDLPFCPVHEKSREDSSTQKLLTTLYNKEKYVIHYRNLKQAIKYGLICTKVHRILEFKQSPWLKLYIDYNSQMRANATNEFEKNLRKLMNNAVFGKTLENKRKHVDVRLVTKWPGRFGMETMIAKPNFHSRAIFDENLVAVQLNKTEICLDKPIYVGFSVLDISKTLMYEFHYGHMFQLYGNKCKLLYMHTDSYVYEIKCDDVYEDIKAHIEKFDTSDYPQDNVYKMPRLHKKIVGLMKDECCGKILLLFIVLRSKMYAMLIDGKPPTKKAKGVKNYIVNETISVEDYIDCLNNCKTLSRSQYLIRSKLHKLQTVKQNKIALSPYDDKRYLQANTTDTLALGH